MNAGPPVVSQWFPLFACGWNTTARPDYRQGWFEIIEPSTSKSGWIYREYLGAISNPNRNQIAS
jgi:hypothetical protein